MRSNTRRWPAVGAAVVLCLLAACGGGSSGDASSGGDSVAPGSDGSAGSGSGGSGGSSGGSSGGTPGGSAPPVSFAAAAGKSGVLGAPIDVRPAMALSGIVSCTIKPGSANAQLFVDVGFTVDDTSCAIGGTPQALLPPTEFTITATAAAATEDAQVTLAVTLPRSTFAYVAQHGLDSIAVYSLDPATGDMSLASVTSTGTGSRPSAVIVDPEKRFLYVANSGTAEIARYAIDASDGTLTALPATPSPGTPLGLAIDPVGRFLFVLHGNGTHVLRSYLIDSSDGSLTAADETPTNNEPLALAVDRTGRFLYVASFGGFFRVAVDQTTGQLSRTMSISLTGAVAFPPSNRGVYAATMATQSVVYYPVGDIANSKEVKRSSTALPFNTLAFDPEGRFLYATLSASSRIESFTVDPQTDELAAAGSITLPAGCNPKTLSVDPGGRFVRTACSDASGKIFTLAVDRSSGALTLASELAADGAAAPTSMETVSLRSRFLYAADAANDEIDVYSIDASTGVLQADASRALQTTPAALTVDRTGGRLYAVSADGSVDAFSIEPTAGGLSPAGTINGGHVGATLVIDPTGRFAYVPNRAANSISRYDVDPATGVLTMRTDLPVVSSPNGIVFHPSGRYAYVINNGAQWWVTMYDVDPTSGALTPFVLTLPSMSLLDPPTAIAIDPTGRFVYIGLDGGHTVASFTVNLADGTLGRTWQSPNGGIAFGYSADSLSVDPTGRYLYVASGNTGDLGMFGIARGQNASDPGELALIDDRALAEPASSLRLDHTGRALYAVLDGGSAALAVLPVDRAVQEIGAETPTAVAAPAASIAVAP